ncbi:MAG: hypothetical protein RI883_1974 [Bacteroidota bacterium]|jgi:outer membrane cobalamin receptor
MNNISKLIFIFTTICISNAYTQTEDTTKINQIKEVVIKEHTSVGGIERMPDLKENVIYAGKKTEVIQLDKINADLSTNNTRQVFAKVPGMSIWENDGSGIQAGIASRGLSPNRSWEFNVRQNGYDISSEVFGYPETYYTPPMEALGKIEVVRGAASLQYGPQFGGLITRAKRKSTSADYIFTRTKRKSTSADYIFTRAKRKSTSADCISTSTKRKTTSADCIFTRVKRKSTRVICISNRAKRKSVLLLQLKMFLCFFCDISTNRKRCCCSW